MESYLPVDFTKTIERRGSGSRKWDAMGAVFGNAIALPLWIADMDFASPPAVVRSLVERANHPIYGYNTQEESLYQSFIEWVRRRHNWEIKKEWILLTPGVVPAISLSILALSEPGDGVIVQTPVYPPFFDSIRDNKRRIVENPLLLVNGRYEIDFADLERKLADSSNKLLLLCSPHNPVGRVWTREELTQVYALCRQHNVDVLADEIHSDLIFPGHRHTVFAALGDPIVEKSVTFMAASKTFNIAGLNLSFVVVPCKERRAKIASWLTRLHLTRNNLFGVLATEAAYREGEPWLADLLKYLEQNVETLNGFIRTRLPEIQMAKQEGTYLAWLDFRAYFPAAGALRNFLVHQAEVGFNPGEGFGKAGEGFARVNFATQRSVLLDALTRIETALQHQKKADR